MVRAGISVGMLAVVLCVGLAIFLLSLDKRGRAIVGTLIAIGIPIGMVGLMFVGLVYMMRSRAVHAVHDRHESGYSQVVISVDGKEDTIVLTSGESESKPVAIVSTGEVGTESIAVEAAAAEASATSAEAATGETTSAEAVPAEAATAEAVDQAEAPLGAQSTTTADIADAARPAWVDLETVQNEAGVQYMRATAGPYTSIQECDEYLPAVLEKAVASYIRDQFGAEAVNAVKVSPEFIRNRIATDYHQELIPHPEYGMMVSKHVRLAFTPEVHRELASGWRQVQADERIKHAGVWAGWAFVLLSSIYGYLRLDTLTKGYYSGRLKLAALAANGAAVAGGSYWLGL